MTRRSISYSTRLVAYCVAAAAGTGGPLGAQAALESPLETLAVQGAVHVIASAASNVVVQVGPAGVVVVDPGAAAQAARTLDAIRTLGGAPIRFIINTHADAEHTGANGAFARAGAGIGSRAVVTVGSGQVGRPEIIAHERVLIRMSAGSAAVAADAWPSSSFVADEKVMHFNGEGIQIVHQPAAHSESDSVVFFRRSDVIAAGDLYSTETYPVIDVANGGTIAGTLAGLNRLLALVIPGEKVEGGTMIVPGHGRISDEADLVEYRDMVTIVRDRIHHLAGKGYTPAQVQAARPTLEYDALYGSAPGWTSAQFVDAVYRTLSTKP
jgi:cyclase